MNQDSFWSTANRPKLAAALAELFGKHDQRKSDLSQRAEGTCEAVVVLAGLMKFEAKEKEQLANAITNCFRQYKETETVGRGADAQLWPTNRFAVAALNVLGFKKPSAQRAA